MSDDVPSRLRAQREAFLAAAAGDEAAHTARAVAVATQFLQSQCPYDAARVLLELAGRNAQVKTALDALRGQLSLPPLAVPTAASSSAPAAAPAAPAKTELYFDEETGYCYPLRVDEFGIRYYIDMDGVPVVVGGEGEGPATAHAPSDSASDSYSYDDAPGSPYWGSSAHGFSAEAEPWQPPTATFHANVANLPPQQPHSSPSAHARPQPPPQQQPPPPPPPQQQQQHYAPPPQQQYYAQHQQYPPQQRQQQYPPQQRPPQQQYAPPPPPQQQQQRQPQQQYPPQQYQQPWQSRGPRQPQHQHQQPWTADTAEGSWDP